MMTARSLIVASLLLLQLSLYAQTARIDVSSLDKRTGMVFLDASKDVGVAQAGWLGDVDKDKRILAEAPIVKGEWRDFSFTFIPKATGILQIELMGEKDKWVEYMELSAKGADLKNGDFSKLDAKGLPEAWTLAGKAELLKSGVKANHDNRVMQRVQVEAGKPVAISFKARAAD